MNFIVVVGLEIHVSLISDRKAFSNEDVNKFSWVTLGFIGTLPFINLEAIEKTIKLSSALNCLVNWKNIFFDRKNYFYYDLPKGYQITQYFHPIGKKGFVELSNGKKIKIKQIHLEEDSAQQIKTDHDIKLTFGRLGKPIVEIVTEPDFNSYEEIEEFLKILRRILCFNRVSNASYEKGEMRIDLNISLQKDVNKKILKTAKSEVKNLNSLYALKESMFQLIDLKKSFLSKGEEIKSYTYGWVERLKKCEVMRDKKDFFDYFYIPESNIPRISLTDERYKEILQETQFNFLFLENELRKSGLKENEINYLLDNYLVFEKVNKLNKKLKNWVSSYNWIVNIVSGYVENFEFFPYSDIEKTILDVEENKKISMKIAKNILKEILCFKLTYKEAVKKIKPIFIVDEKIIKKIVLETLDQYKDSVTDLMKNPTKFEKLIIGSCMKKTGGQIDPLKTKELFDKLLPNYLKTL